VNDVAKKKIVFVISGLGGGGAERVLLDLLNALHPARYKISLIVFENKGVYAQMVPSHVTLYDLKKKGRWDFFRLVIELAYLLKRLWPDTLVSFLSYTSLAVVPARFLSFRKMKMILTEHGHVSSLLSYEPWKPLRRFLFRICFPSADLCVAPSIGVAEDLVRNFGVRKEKVKIIHNPVDLAKIERLKRESLKCEGLTSGAYLVAVGRLTPVKGYVYLLKAYALLVPRILERLVILGEGEEREHLEELARSLGIADRVLFVGFRQNPYTFMGHSALFVHSSLSESFALVIVEAMASGAAVIATDCPTGPREIVTDGVNGVLIAPADEKKLADAVLSLLRDPVRRGLLIENGKERARDFDLRNILPCYESIF
jgi:glycosyltransferase involved in cell wall biosynthesis